jgi:hypothetical protein
VSFSVIKSIVSNDTKLGPVVFTIGCELSDIMIFPLYKSFGFVLGLSYTVSTVHLNYGK